MYNFIKYNLTVQDIHESSVTAIKYVSDEKAPVTIKQLMIFTETLFIYIIQTRANRLLADRLKVSDLFDTSLATLGLISRVTGKIDF